MMCPVSQHQSGERSIRLCNVETHLKFHYLSRKPFLSACLNEKQKQKQNTLFESKLPYLTYRKAENSYGVERSRYSK